MNNKYIIAVLLFAVVCISAITKDDGRAGATGSPGETTCNTSNCHTGNTINSPTGSITINATTMPGWVYFPGQTYPIEVTVSRTGNSLFGLGFEALRSTGANGGTLTITNSVQTQLKAVSVGGNVRTNVVHKLNGGASANSHSFTFNWTAPPAGTGNVTLFAAGNAANGNGSASGDFIFNTSQIVTESPVGISEYDSNYLNVFPNPVKEKLNIEINLQKSTVITFSLLNIEGKSSQIHIAELQHGQTDISIPISEEIKSGVYILQLNGADINLFKKIIILR